MSCPPWICSWPVTGCSKWKTEFPYLYLSLSLQKAWFIPTLRNNSFIEFLTINELPNGDENWVICLISVSPRSWVPLVGNGREMGRATEKVTALWKILLTIPWLLLTSGDRKSEAGTPPEWSLTKSAAILFPYALAISRSLQTQAVHELPKHFHNAPFKHVPTHNAGHGSINLCLRHFPGGHIFLLLLGFFHFPSHL